MQDGDGVFDGGPRADTSMLTEMKYLTCHKDFLGAVAIALGQRFRQLGSRVLRGCRRLHCIQNVYKKVRIVIARLQIQTGVVEERP